MQELFRFVESPRECSYLSYETAALEVRLVASMSPQEYSVLLEEGWRRFGMQLFRPVCPSCNQCRSVRIPVDRFTPSASQRRTWRNNQHLRAELHSPFATQEIVNLYNRYQRFMSQHRNWELQQADMDSYFRQFVAGSGCGAKQWLFFDGVTLVGTALMDEVPDAISLVYCFYHPDWRAHSIGTWSILTQLEYAKRKGLANAYLGYWVEACQSLAYKSKYQPLEERGDDGIWR